MKSTMLQTPHDGIFKVFLSKPAIAYDFIDIHLPEEFKQQINLSTLHLESGSFVSDMLRQSYSDVLYSVKSKQGKDAYIYLLLEHQSTSDPLMPFRLLRYSLEVMHQHLEQEKKKNNKKCTKLPLVVPLVFYQGQEKYKHSMSFIDCFADKPMAEKLYSKPFQLIELAKFDDDEILEHRKAALLELAQRHIKDDDMLGIAEFLGTALHESKPPHELFKSLMYYINECGNVSDGEEFLNAIARANPNYKDDIMKLEQPFIDKGIQQGKLQIVQNMVQQGLDSATIKQYTGLTDAALAKLTQSMNTMSDAAASGSANIATASNQEFGDVAHSSRKLRSHHKD